MNFLEELKRRNVFRVGIAYAVVGWLIMQITDTFAPALRLPEWFPSAVAFLLLIGLPIALFFAWAYEMTPDGLKRDSGVAEAGAMATQTRSKLDRAIMAGLVLALGYFIWESRWKDQAPAATNVTVEATTDTAAAGPDETPETGSVAQATPASSPDGGASSQRPATGLIDDSINSVAVLPFVNMSADPDNEYFSDGISEELLNLLVKVDGLRVPSRTSSFAFKGRNSDIREIARQLNVKHILEGSVRKSGNQVRVTAQLIDVSTDTHLWSDTYDRELENIFVIQDEIAGHIVDSLKLTLAGTASENPQTDNITAYNHYLRGLFLFQQRGEALLEAANQLRLAVELDPEFAEAWAILGLTYSMHSNYLFLDSSVTEAPALEAARKAAQLDASLAEPDMVFGNYATKHGDHINGILHLERAVALQPRDALARVWYAVNLLVAGYTAEALDQLLTAQQLDPVSGVLQDWLSRAYWLDGQPEKALETAHQALELGRWQVILTISWYHLAREEYDELRKQLVVIPYPDAVQAFQWVVDATEDPAQKPAALEWIEMHDDRPNFAFLTVFVGALLNEPGRVFNYLPKAVMVDESLTTFLWVPDATPLRQHPGMRDYARSHGLLALWQSRGFPDLCHATEQGFACD